MQIMAMQKNTATSTPPMRNHRGLVPPTNIMMAPNARMIKVAERWLSKKINAATKPIMAT